MEYIIIFLTLAVIGGIGFYAYWILVPYDIYPLAENAGFKRFSWRYKRMKMQNIPVKFLLEQYVKALEVNVTLDFDDLIDYYLTYPDDTEKMISVLIRGKRAGVRVGINDLEKFQISGGDIEQLVKALKIVKNANINVSRDVLETHSLYGGDIATFVGIILRAKKADINMNLQDLVEENLSDEDMQKIVDILIRAKKAGLYISETELQKINKEEADEDEDENPNADLRISQRSILEHFRANIDIEKYARAMIKAKKAGLEIDKKALNIHYLTDGDMEKLVSTMIKAEKAGIGITQNELVQNNLEGKDVGKIVKYIIKAKQAEIPLTPGELIDFHRIGGDAEKFVEALIISKKAHLGIGKKELEEHHLAGADVLEYVKARKVIKENVDLEITVSDLDAHYIKGGNMLKALYAILYAKKNNIEISPKLAFVFDLIPNTDINDVVNWAVNPQILNVEPSVAVVVKNGMQITLKLHVTIRGKIALFRKGSREEVLFGRINEAVAEEIPKYQTHKEVLANLNNISENVYKKIAGKAKPYINDGVTKFEAEEEYKKINEKERKLNESSAYEVLDIKVFDLEVGQDTLADYHVKKAEQAKKLAEIHAEEHNAHAHGAEVDARIRLVNAKAKVQEGMAEAFQNGQMDMNAYQTEKHIFGSFKDDDDKGHGGH